MSEERMTVKAEECAFVNEVSLLIVLQLTGQHPWTFVNTPTEKIIEMLEHQGR
jgi:hypothetical protein